MPLFEVSHLSRPGLRDVSLSLSAAELVCLSGPSGTGKTLLLRSLADLDVNHGEVFLDGVERDRIAPTQWRRQVGYLPAESRWWAARVGDHIGSDHLDLLNELGFNADVLAWEVERLSSGERQRLAVVRLLANQPRVLLLDEPTANLDPANTLIVEKLVSDYLKSHRAACLWVTHAQDQLGRLAGRALFMNETGIHKGMPS